MQLTENSEFAARPIASRRHLAIFLAIQLAAAVSQGSLTQRMLFNSVPNESYRRMCLYLTVIACEWLLLVFVWLGIRKTHTALNELIAGRWRSAPDVAKDAFIGCASWLLWIVTAALVMYGLGLRRGPPDNLIAMLPASLPELGLWLMLSATAGFVEEVVYRGYLQRQLLALSRSHTIAVAGQALVFGLAHSYQGIVNVAAITTLAVLLGLLAMWRKSLRPGMILHMWLDGLTGTAWYILHGAS